ncbi:MAG: FkbM family methyltransferase [Acetobacteraceae bacterium]|nr:FkbM family methyltransferase [Acetobacteraceae bacterium]
MTDAEADAAIPPGEWREAVIAGRACRVLGNPRDVYFANLAGVVGEQALLARIAAAVLPADGVALDVGANIGLAALTLAPLVPQGRVHSFEPVPEPLAYLRANAVADPLGNIEVVPLAVGAAPGRIAIHPGANFSAGSHVVDAAHAFRGGLPVLELEMTALDAWAAARGGLPRLDLIKLDVEGYEIEALDGAAGLLAAHRPVVVLELNSFTLIAMRDRNPRSVVEELMRRFRHVLWFAPDKPQPLRLRPGQPLYGFIHDHLVHRRAIDELVCCDDDAWLGTVV